MANIKGYTKAETAQIEAFRARHKADTRTWQERVVANAPESERAALAAHLGVEAK
jgi:hypothetical protein